MAGGKWKEEAAVRATWDGKPLEQGIKRTDNAVSGFKKNVADVGKIMVGAFASQAAMKGLQLMGQGVRKLGREFLEAQKLASDYEASQSRLTARMKLQGETYEKHAAAIDAATDAMYRYAGASKGEVLETLSRLYRYTGDMDKAVRSLAATYDFMADQKMNAATASRYIAMAWEGETMMLNRYIPAMRQLTKEQAKNGEFLKVFANELAGQATAATRTYGGTLETLRGQLNDVRIALATPVNDALKGSFEKLADEIHELNNSGALDETKQHLGQIATNIIMTADALFGGGGVGGAIDGINQLLSRFENYTASPDFTRDLTTAAAAIKAIAQFGWEATKIIGILLGSKALPQIGAGATGRAAGGMIPGEFDGDKIPFVGQGEYIVNPTATKKWKPFLDWLNFAESPSQYSGAGFASGGLPDADYMRQRFSYAKSIEWIIQQMGMGSAGIVNLETFLSRNVAPSSFGAATYAIAEMRRNMASDPNYQREISGARSTLFDVMSSKLAEVSKKTNEANRERFTKFLGDPSGISNTRLMRLFGGIPEKVAADGGSKPAWSPFDKDWLASMTATGEQIYGKNPELNYTYARHIAQQKAYEASLKKSGGVAPLDTGALAGHAGVPPAGSASDPYSWLRWIDNPMVRASGIYAGVKYGLPFAWGPMAALGSIPLTKHVVAPGASGKASSSGALTDLMGGGPGYSWTWQNQWSNDDDWLKRLLQMSFGYYGGRYPQFASGGIVPGAPGEPILVLAHGGEEFRQRVPGMASRGEAHGQAMDAGQPVQLSEADPELKNELRGLTMAIKQASSGSGMSQAMVARGISHILFHGMIANLPEMKEDLEKLKKVTPGFSHG